MNKDFFLAGAGVISSSEGVLRIFFKCINNLNILHLLHYFSILPKVCTVMTIKHVLNFAEHLYYNQSITVY